MHVRCYRQPSVREALARAREELGPDALVLSTRLVAVQGWRSWVGAREVEVTVAADRAVSGNRASEQRFRQSMSPGRGHDAVVARLCAAGLDRGVAAEIASTLPDTRRRGTSPASLRQALADRLAPLAAGEEPYAPIEVFVGLPGAGKTTTIAKIAAQERARHGARLGVIAADGYRVGALEQLRLYADIITTTFTTARTAPDRARARAHVRRPVLVDTAGRSPGDPAARDVLEVLAGCAGVRTHLVIAAGSSARDVARMFEGYDAAHPTRVVLTKLDETESLSPLVGVLRERQLPISYLCTGQRVPEDLNRATAPLLAAYVLGETAGILGAPA